MAFWCSGVSLSKSGETPNHFSFLGKHFSKVAFEGGRPVLDISGFLILWGVWWALLPPRGWVFFFLFYFYFFLFKLNTWECV